MEIFWNGLETRVTGQHETVGDWNSLFGEFVANVLSHTAWMSSFDSKNLMLNFLSAQLRCKKSVKIISNHVYLNVTSDD